MRVATEEHPVPAFCRVGERRGRAARNPPLPSRRVLPLSRPAWCAGLPFVLLGVVASGMSWGPCRIDEGLDAAVMVRHLKGACRDEDRQAFSVSADDVLEALRQGKGVDLRGVVLAGDLSFDRLPLKPFESERVRVPEIVNQFEAEHVPMVRVIDGPFILEDVEVRGILATNLVDSGYVLVRGPVRMRGTVIQRAMDLSRMVFLDHADFSAMRIDYEGFFIHAIFAGDADFTRTDFGTHSRFHRARFLGKVAFAGARFHGLAEFLEVSFGEDAGFSSARFAQGTGFSGSRFHRAADFSDARFEREVYFRFTAFREKANFRRTLFRSEADFTEAQFGGDTDFRGVVAETTPWISGTGFPERVEDVPGVRTPETRQYWFAVGLLALLCLAGLLVWKRKCR